MCHVSASKAFRVAMLIHNERGFSLYVSTSWACFLCWSVVLHIWCWCSLGPPAQPLAVVWRLQSSALSLSLPHPLQGSHGMKLCFHHLQNCEHTLSAPPRTSSSDLCLLMPVTPEVLRPAEKLSGGRVGTVYSSEMPFSCSLNSLFSSRSCSKVFLPFPLRC